jgi:hypothetical protein
MNETYIDSRGAEMPRMDFSEALELVHDLASGNQVDSTDIAFGDKGLAGQRAWQQRALDTLHDLVVNHGERLDELAHPERAGDWPEAALAADRALDPAQPANAIRICLAMAEQVAIDPEGADGVELADEIDRQQQALDVTRDFLGMHAAQLDQVLLVGTGPLFKS